MVNYIYRQTRSSAYGGVPMEGFVLIDDPWKLLMHYGKVLRSVGPRESAKLLAKSFTRNRQFFFIAVDGRIATHGSAAISFCNYYGVEANGVVIGAIWTDPAFRGRGYATRGIMNAMNRLMSRGHSVFYIDTQENNFPMQRSIEKLGFGDAVGQFETTEGE